MRQALRDRCREVQQGRGSLLRLLVAELLPDLIESLWEEHTMSFSGSSHRRVLAWIGALGALALVIPQADRLGDWMYRSHSPRAVAWQKAEDAHARQRRDVQGFLAFLDAQNTTRANALRLALDPVDDSSWQPDEYSSSGVADLTRYREQVERLYRHRLGEMELAGLASACLASIACDESELAARFHGLPSDNGYEALWSFEAARLVKDEEAMKAAMQRMVDAPRFSSSKTLLMQELLRQRSAYGHEDVGLDAALFERSLGFRSAPLHGLSETCEEVAEVQVPELQGLCHRIGSRLLQSGDLRDRLVGARLAYRFAGTDIQRDEAVEQYRQAAWLADHYPPRVWDTANWHESQADHWWLAWQSSASEVDALSSWQRTNGVASSAPGAYALAPMRLRRLVAGVR